MIAADEIEQSGERNRRGNLVADVVRMVQVLAAGERFAGDFGDARWRSAFDDSPRPLA